MEPVAHDRAKSIFLRVVDRPAKDRASLLDEECEGDAALRKRVEELLLHHDEDASTDLADLGPRVASPPGLAPGAMVGGRFRIQRLIGKGGMGEVYLASDEELGGEVAIKLLLPALLHNVELRARFRREVHLARRVTHPNVCRIFDLGHERVAGVERLYLTMEYVNGSTLADRIRRRGKYGTEEALPILRQAAAGLGALHAHNIVHRDLKPGNVMLQERPGGDSMRVVIGDLGLARAVIEDSREEGLSQSGMVLGTPGYMAPEQLTGAPVSAATDVFAFGLLAYEMVTGRKAYPSSSTTGDPPPPPRMIEPGLPLHWDKVILRCLEKDPVLRPRSAEAVVSMLAGDSRLRPLRAGSRRRWWLGAGAAAVFAAAASGVYLTRARSGGSYRANDAYLASTELLSKSYKSANIEKAIQLLEPASREPDASALLFASLGRAYWLLHRRNQDPVLLQKASEATTVALRKNPDTAPARVTLAGIYLLQAKHDLAQQELDLALKIDAYHAEAFTVLADLHAKRGRTNEVESALQKAVDLEPDNWRWSAALGLFYRDRGRLEEAAKLFQRVIALTPDNASVYDYLV